MKAWRLALKLLWHTLRGRGGDDVYLYHSEGFGHVEWELPCHTHDWALTHVAWSDDRDHFLTLEARREPAHNEPTYDEIAAEKRGSDR